jgi:uncharacterized protein
MMAKGELAERLKRETVTAMKERDKDTLTILRMLQAAVKQIEVDTREELDEDGLIKVFRSYAKKVKDSIEGARQSGRDELIAAAVTELAVVQTFLPAELPDETLETMVDEAIAETGAESMKDMGRVMKATMEKVAGRADGGRVNPIVKKRLNR